MVGWGGGRLAAGPHRHALISQSFVWPYTSSSSALQTRAACDNPKLAVCCCNPHSMPRVDKLALLHILICTAQQRAPADLFTWHAASHQLGQGWHASRSKRLGSG